MDVSKWDAGLADGNMAVGRTGCGGCSLYLAGHYFVIRASSFHSVGRGSASGVHAGSSGCHRGSLYVVRAARWTWVRRGAAGPWGAGSPYCTSAFAPGGSDCSAVLRPVLGGQFNHSRRGMEELEVIRTATRG